MDKFGGTQGKGNKLTHATHAAYEGARQQNGKFVQWLRTEKLATLESQVAAQSAQDTVTSDMIWGSDEPSQMDVLAAHSLPIGGLADLGMPLEPANVPPMPVSDADLAMPPMDDSGEGETMQDEPEGSTATGSWLDSSPPDAGGEENRGAEPQIKESWIDDFWGGEN